MKIIGIEDQEEKRRELNRKKILVILVIFIILLISVILAGLYIGNESFREMMDQYVLMKNISENSVTSISLEETQSNQVYAYDKYISVLNQNTLVGYNDSGKKEYELTVEISNPLVDTNNRFLLIAEKGKQKIYLISGNTIIWDKQLEGNISRVSVNKNGYVSVILTGTNYQSIIETFDNTGKELFKTYLVSSIAMDSDISYDNKYLSFAEISTNGTLVQSMVKTIPIQKAQETHSESIISTIATRSNSTILNLTYQEGNKLICMYDDAIYCIQNETQEELVNLLEEGKRITFADIELTNFVCYVKEKNILLSTETTAELMNTANKKVNTYTLNSGIKEVYSYDHSIALNLGSEVHFIGTNGWLIKKYTSSQEVRKIVMNANFAGIVYHNKIEIIEL